jgi:oxygen-independent coproporphyrinogen-3 oxidase
LPDGAAPREDWRAGGFGVYVHWPFCAAKCPYCDFNSHVRAGVDQERWRRALVEEVRRAAAETPGRTVDTVFFGGGTPSLMPPETVAAVLDAARGGWGLRPGAEVTLEANPTSAEAGRFRGYAAAGVTRLSLGVQSLRDRDLRALGRLHSAAEARAAFDLAREAFGQVSFDLIYARPGQDVAAWRAELGEALGMAVDHLSLYQLTIEPGTRFGELAARGRMRGLPGDALAADLYRLTQEMAAAAGLPAYEVSNHARPGAEARHNLVYWRCGDFAGVGPGAHGRLTIDGRRWATEAVAAPEAWLAAAARGAAARRVETPPAEQAVELMMMGLRLREGVDLERYGALAGAPPPTGRLDELEALGLARRAGSRLAATEAGRAVLDAVLARLLA